MSSKVIENTLFLGNGFTRSVFQDMPSWGDLFDGTDSSIKNYTILYEAFRLHAERADKEEDTVKAELIQKIKTTFSDKNIREDIYNLENFGQYLFQYHVYNIITTNYDNGIEFILCDTCGYREQAVEGMVPERIYSIRTHKTFINDKTGHQVKLWKIHGDVSRIKSVMLGFDQYCGSLSKLISYVKGTYESSQAGNKACCKIPMKKKCEEQMYDGISWIELFFCTNLYIAGFGMDFSEIDIWWLLNKRARFLLEVPEIKNSITYLYNKKHESEAEKAAIFAALRAFQVSYSSIKPGKDYINSIFESMTLK